LDALQAGFEPVNVAQEELNAADDFDEFPFRRNTYWQRIQSSLR
jgi:hypothetical protein